MLSWIRIGLIGATAVCALGSAQAAEYKWVGPDGRVNYSDKAPPPGAELLRTGSRNAAAPIEGDEALPYAVRMPAAKYPVSLYVTKDCGPCKTARDHLVKRGIPFAEISLRNRTDADAFKKLGFDGQTLPGLLVGRQTATGYEAGSYDALLDAAGYPKSSMLPANYVFGAPKPLSKPPPEPSDNDAAIGNAESAASAAPVAKRMPPAPPPAIPVRQAATGGDPNFRF